ncbi:hypothetical protein P8C59_007513 [Phyllachora maydis]|uniref:Uncharacterized protein n=1 Tax=Phyllachora maydis TaxID=1825666 RepID=A0AAD9MEA6_9PEZI|nr:hypothetical protein P8C59_007513 [Phyllachora maydis]
MPSKAGHGLQRQDNDAQLQARGSSGVEGVPISNTSGAHTTELCFLDSGGSTEECERKEILKTHMQLKDART